MFRLSMVAVLVLLGAPSVHADAVRPRPTRLVLTCPVNQTLMSSDGNAVTATYAATVSGGIAPRVVAYSITSGSAFSVGTTTVQVNASSADGQSASCAFTVTVTYTPPVVETYGPSSNITCPVGAVQVPVGATTIQAAVTANSAGTMFCLSGIYSITGAITPKTGDTFVGEYGAVLDGTGWFTTDTTQGAFRAWNANIDNVTIRNLTIQHMPQKGIAESGHNSTNWILDAVEVTYCARDAVNVPDYGVLKNSNIHDNPYGGYTLYQAHDVVFQHNAIAYNGTEQKVVGAQRVSFLNNWVHHNKGDGIWYDTDNTGSIIDGNLVEANGRHGIDYEISGQGVIRNNIVKTNVDTAIILVTSKDVEVYGNTVSDNYRGIRYYLKCDIQGGGGIGWDLTNDSVHDNTVVVTSRQPYALANGINWPSSGSCTAAQTVPYMDGSKNLTFVNNHYTIPVAATRYWLWGWGIYKSWAEWQALGNDTTGSVIVQ